MKFFKLAVGIVLLLLITVVGSPSVGAYSFPVGWTTHPIEAKLSYPNGSTRAQTYCNTRTSGSFNVSTLFPAITFSPWGGKIESSSILAITFDVYDGDVARTRISFDSSSGSPLVPLGVEVGSTSSQVTYNVYYWNTSQINTGQILNHYLDIWVPAGSCMRMIGGVNYTKLNTSVNVDVDTSSIVDAINNLNNTTSDLSTKIDTIDNLIGSTNDKLDGVISGVGGVESSVNDPKDQQQQQWEEEETTTSGSQDSAESDADSAVSDTETATASLFDVLTSVVGAITNASAATSCNIDMSSLPLNLGTVDICDFPVPTFITVIGSILAIVILVPIAISVLRDIIGLLESFTR